ncbi:MAG TPA: isoprenylcysteine carboxylmethyltransferase family protein [Pirellulales bacterium]|nr:isoprenylcysteine carboxylmethyltransferase family protein [Pirellulales bacterium]
MKRILVFAYGLTNYLVFMGTSLYLAGFLGNQFVPRSIDAAPAGPLWAALLVNTLLLAAFAVQHSVMARPRFKQWWTRFVPTPAERSTYVMFSNLALILLFWQWRPMGGVIWDVREPIVRGIIHGLFTFGWLNVLLATFLINHFDLFGVRQVWLYLRGKPYTSLAFKTPGPYRLVRHPLYVGWLMAFWAAPTMTVAHLFFAVGMTVYILVAIRLEERDLIEHHGEAYADYRRKVPMLIPLPFSGEDTRRHKDTSATTVEARS